MLGRTGSVKRGVVSPDLLEERAKCAFDQDELRVFLHGSQERLDLWRQLVDTFGADEGLRNNIEFYDMTPHEMQENLWKRINVMYQKHKDRIFNKSMIAPPYVDWQQYFQGLLPGIGLQITMFRLSVENLANEEQKARWMPQITNVDMIGCYAQTELGHGSNVAALETTATLDMATDEFVIHTPTITATKYWPGDLGRFTSHAIVFARLIIGKKDYGVQPFLVQIRDVDTWRLRPGCNAGDLGPKIGYQSKDNGWCTFNQVRIPRTNMLMGLCDVSAEGKLTKKGDARVLYSVMMGIRMLIVQSQGFIYTMQATRNAIRYCSVRRQFSSQEGTREERKVIDYQTTSATLARLLARGVTMTVVGCWVTQEFSTMMEEIGRKVFTRMDVNHHLLSGFKALFSQQALSDVEEARRTCGGAGYQSNSGFTSLFAGVSPIPTYEGDNTVMLGQASRFLIKLITLASQGKKLPFPFTYLCRLQETLGAKNQARTVEDFHSMDLLDRALQARACNLINSTMRDYTASTASAKVKDNELFYQAKVTMTRAHLKYLQFHLYRTQCATVNFRDARIGKLLDLSGKIWALEELLEDGSACYDSGFFAPGTYRAMQQAMEQCVAEIRPQLVPLSETPYLPDHVVPSVTGNSYGDIYEMQLEYAQKSRLNINNEVPEYFERLMKPILMAKL